MINIKLYPINRILSMMVILSMALGFSVTPALAEDPPPPLPPANNDIADAIDITNDVINNGEFENVLGVRGATTEETDPLIPTTGGRQYYHSVWYKYSPEQTGQVVMHTMGDGYSNWTGYDTILAIYDGDPTDGGTLFGWDDNSAQNFKFPQEHGSRTASLRGCELSSALAKTLTAGKTYWIEVVSKEDEIEDSTLVFTVYPTYLQSDSFSDAIEIDGRAYAFDDVQDITNATVDNTTEPYDPIINIDGTHAQFHKTVWYTYTPVHTSEVYFSAQNDNWDAILAVFIDTDPDPNVYQLEIVGDPSRGDPARAGTNLRDCHAEGQFTLDAGTTYYIEIAAETNYNNHILFFHMEIPDPLPSLKSDLVSEAIIIPNGDNVDWYEDMQDTTNANTDDEPGINLGEGPQLFYRSVWYAFTPTMDGVVNLSNEGSDYPIVIGLFSGDFNDLPGSLSPIAAYYPDPEEGEALKGTRGCEEYYTLQYELSAGTTYFFEFAAHDDLGEQSSFMYMSMSYWTGFGPDDDVWDDDSDQIGYDSRWQLTEDENAIGGTMHTATRKKSSATSTFEGSRFTIVYAKLAKAGTLNILVDRRKVATLNQNSRAASYQQRWSFASVPDGTHTLAFTNAKGKTVNVDAVMIMGPAQAAEPGTIEDTDNDFLAYKGYWQPDNDLGVTSSSKKGDTITLTFIGSQVTLNYLTARTYGKVQVTIDGKRNKATVKQNGSTGSVWSSSSLKKPLAYGTHTLIIKNLGNKPVNLDSLVIE